MKKWKYSVTVSDETGGFYAKLKYNDLKAALKTFCHFVTIDCDIVHLLDEEGVLIQYVK